MAEGKPGARGARATGAGASGASEAAANVAETGAGPGAKPAWMVPHGRPWEDHGGRTVYDNPWLAVTEHAAVAPSGKAVERYGVVRFKNRAVAVLPLHEDGTVTLVGQHRFPAGDYVWEIPEGGGAPDEPPFEAAKRELREETGLEARDWRAILPRVQVSNSTTDEHGVGFLAMGFSKVDREPDETEVLAVVRAPFAEALDAALRGWIVDLLSVAMLLRAHHMAATGELPDGLARAMLGRPG